MMDQCWICESTRLHRAKPSGIRSELTSDAFAITNADYGITGELLRCEDCGFLQCSELTDVLKYYETLEDTAYDTSRQERLRQAQFVLRKIPPTHADGALLDIGAGIGSLVEEARKLGYSAEGIEPSQWLCERGRSKGLPIVRGTFPHPEVTGPYDVITVVDVLEHVPDPVGLLRHTVNALKPGGIVLVVTPDLGSLTARLMGWRWWHFRIAHIGYFNKRTLEAAAARSGLRIQDTYRPTWYFTAGYLIDRVHKYLPSFLRFHYPGVIRNRVIPLDLRDSILAVMAPTEKPFA